MNTVNASTYNFNQKISQLTNKSYNDIYKTLTELSENQYITNFNKIEDINSIHKIIISNNNMVYSNISSESIKNAETTNNSIVFNINNMIELMENLRSDISVSDLQNSNKIVVDNIQDIKENFISLLNFKQENNYIFSGTKSNAPAIIDDPKKSYDNIEQIIGFDNIDNIIPYCNTDYYGGSNKMRNILINDHDIIEYGVTADQEPFMLCFVSFDMIQETKLEDLNAKESILTIIDSAINQLINTKSNIEYQNRLLLQQNKIQENYSTYNLEYVSSTLNPEKNIADLTIEFTQMVNDKDLLEGISLIAMNILNTALKF